MEPRSYELIFEARRGQGRCSMEIDGAEETGEYSYVLGLRLVPATKPEFGILKVGGPVTSHAVLCETAHLA